MKIMRRNWMESQDLMTMIEVDPSTIKIKDDLPRVRNDLGEVEKLLESFNRYGQLQPIVVNRDMELIAGGRRLAACLLGGRKALIVYKDTMDPLIMREMELEENLQRKSLTPAEELMAIDEIHKLKQSKYGESVSGRQGGWTVEKTAELVGRTRTSILDDLKLADALKQFPDLSSCSTKSEIRKAVKGMEKLVQRMSAVSEYEKKIEGKTTRLYSVECADAFDHMLRQTTKSIDLLLTDPLYGIDIDEIAIGAGGVTGGFSGSGIKYSDTKDEAIKQYKVLAKESFRFCKDNSHAFVFTSPSNFGAAKHLFSEAGWLCSDRPLIWIKNESGQNNNPSMWFSAAYEIILFARKPAARLVIEGKPDWIQMQPVLPSEKMHQAQKPLSLLKELISRTTLPGSISYDPFMGSGSSIIAGLDMKLFPIGCDIAQESYSTTMFRLIEWQKANNTI
jgi:ParB/RepB/Spo0J family partition protein